MYIIYICESSWSCDGLLLCDGHVACHGLYLEGA